MNGLETLTKADKLADKGLLQNLIQVKLFMVHFGRISLMVLSRRLKQQAVSNSLKSTSKTIKQEYSMAKPLGTQSDFHSMAHLMHHLTNYSVQGLPPPEENSLRWMVLLYRKRMKTMQWPSEKQPAAQNDRTRKQRYNEICELESYNRLISDYWAMSAPTTQHRLAAG